MSEPATPSSQAILETVGRYYADRLERFGPTPQGVDWSSAESQALRFNRLLLLVEDVTESLNDYGCGYGALADYLREGGWMLEYRGFDISDAMIRAASARHTDDAGCSFTSDSSELRPADYSISSGIFNVKLHHSSDVWREYVWETLETLHRLSTRGFAFNMLSMYSDPEKRRPDLFYADPLETFDLCRRRFSGRAALLHDYPLYEFTILVRK